MTINGIRATAAPTSRTTMTAADAAKVATDFYAAFGRGDSEAMSAAYDAQVSFHDPLFGTLKGAKKVMEMWNTTMRSANPKTSRLEPRLVGAPAPQADGSFEVKVHWDAHYDLGSRHVENHADTTLRIKDGKIVAQRDDWDLDAWTKQAVPLIGGTRAGDVISKVFAHGFVELKDAFDR